MPPCPTPATSHMARSRKGPHSVTKKARQRDRQPQSCMAPDHISPLSFAVFISSSRSPPRKQRTRTRDMGASCGTPQIADSGVRCSQEGPHVIQVKGHGSCAALNNHEASSRAIELQQGPAPSFVSLPTAAPSSVAAVLLSPLPLALFVQVEPAERGTEGQCDIGRIVYLPAPAHQQTSQAGTMTTTSTPTGNATPATTPVTTLSISSSQGQPPPPPSAKRHAFDSTTLGNLARLRIRVSPPARYPGPAPSSCASPTVSPVPSSCSSSSSSSSSHTPHAESFEWTPEHRPGEWQTSY